MSTLMIPYNHQPESTVQLNTSPNSTATYYIPAGKYARVSYHLRYGGFININDSSIAHSATATDYSHPSAAEPYETGWYEYHSNCTVSVTPGSSNESTIYFDPGWEYKNYRFFLTINNAYQPQQVRVCLHTDTNHYVPLAQTRGLTTPSLQEYVVQPEFSMDPGAGQYIQLKLHANIYTSQSATLFAHGVRRRIHAGKGNDNISNDIWLKSGDKITIGETHFTNSTAMCHIELYNEQS
tara:strand:- start:12 stop:725 length:714 start_codon:yes stop_codon:yes gene_type:complete